MDVEEAYRVLGVRRGDSDITIKTKYRKLMFLYHPDVAGDEDEALLRMAQRVNEAYSIIRNNGTSRDWKPDDSAWKAAVNPKSYAERGIYVDYSFFDIQVPIREVARGRYLWDPYIEEFEMLMKSIHDVCLELLEEEDRKHQIYTIEEHPDPEFRQLKAVRLFHLMMQEFIDPISCIEKLGTPAEAENSWLFDGAVGLDGPGSCWSNETEVPKGTLVHAVVNDTKIMIVDGQGEIIGPLSFDDDSLYYVITPLIETGQVTVDCAVGEMHVMQSGRRRKLDILITVTIESTEPYRMSDFRSEIQRILEATEVNNI